MFSFLTVCLNPTIQKTYFHRTLRIGTVNRAVQSFIDISGKGINVTRVLHGLGEKAVHLTHLGGPFAPFFRRRAAEEGLYIYDVHTRADIRFCITLIDQSTRRVTEIVEEGFPVSAMTEYGIRRSYERLIRKSKAVIISGTRSPGYTDDLFPDMVRLAVRAGVFVLADIRGNDLVQSLPFGPFVIKPNLSEFLETFLPHIDPSSRTNKTLEQVDSKIQQLVCDFKVQAVITDGGGPIVYTDGTSLKTLLPESIEPVNTTGCGDAFAAGFAQAYCRSRNMDEAVICGLGCAKRNALSPRPGFMVSSAESEP